MEERFVISKLAKLTGYTPAMIRYFEKAGVITPSNRSAGGYRLFGSEHVKELQFVRQMQQLGFLTQYIKELREIKKSSFSEGEKKKAIKKIFEEHSAHIEERINHLSELQKRIREADPHFVYKVLEKDPE